MSEHFEGQSTLRGEVKLATETGKREYRKNARGQLATVNARLASLLNEADAQDNDRLGSQALRNLLLERSAAPEHGGASWLELVCLALVRRAADGDVKAAALVFERAFGKPHTDKVSDGVQKIAMIVSQLAPVAQEIAGPKRVTSAETRVDALVSTSNDGPEPHRTGTPSTTDRPPGLIEPRLPHTPSEPPSELVTGEYIDE